MNVAILNSHTLLASHYETELEIILDHLDENDRVTQLVCDAELPACDTNPYFSPEACSRCMNKRKLGFNRLLNESVRVQSMIYLTPENKKSIALVKKQFNTIAELKALWVDNFDVGYAVASSIISLKRDPDPSLDPSLVERFIVSSLAVYYSTINYLNAHKTDVFYVFNGRLSNTKAALRACQKLGVLCRIHERGNSMNYYSLFDNVGIHDLKNTQRIIREDWHKADPQRRTEIATKWFETRVGGKMENWYSFLENQEFSLPEGWNPQKRNILICNSSEDELAAIGDDWKNHVYLNQSEGIKRITKDLSSHENVHVYLRIHPHLAKVNNASLAELLGLKQPNLTIIPPQSKISTYHLILNADKVITFGSTIGIEATFLRKPSILAGKSFYYNLGASYDPENHQSLLELVLADIEPKPLDNALMVAYFFATFGQPFKRYKPEDFGAGTIHGVRISDPKQKADWAVRFVYHNKNFPKISEYLQLRRRQQVHNNLLA